MGGSRQAHPTWRSLSAHRNRPRHVRRAVPSILGLLAATPPLRCSRRRHRPSGTAPPTTGLGAGRAVPLRGICSYLDGRDGVVQVALWDQRAGRLYRLSNGDDTQYTASIVKVDILARWLRTYDKQGASIPDDIPYSIKYLMQRMIQNSDNAAATSLFYFGGGCDSLTKFNPRIPMDDTKVGCQTRATAGATPRQAADQARSWGVRLRPRSVLSSDPGLRQPACRAGRKRFGSCGLGHVCDRRTTRSRPGRHRSVKNGWKTLPTCTKPVDQCPGRSTARAGCAARAAIRPDRAHDPRSGWRRRHRRLQLRIDTIQNVSQLVWANLGANNRGR